MLNIYFVFLSYLLFVTDIVQCTPDYHFSLEAGGWLKLHTTPATWEEAFLQCHYEGAVLASPLNKQLANALHSLMASSGINCPIFLGTHDFYSNGDYVSVEGVPLRDLEIREKSGTNNSENITGDCLTMYIEGRAYYMTKSPGSQPRPFICYTKIDNQTINDCGTFDNRYNLSKITGSCYKVHKEKQTWSRAYKICAAEGGYLVVLNDKEEAEIVRDMAFPTPQGVKGNAWDKLHIGLRAWGEDRTWITVRGDRIEDVFNDWHSGQPDNYRGKQFIATFLRIGKMDDDYINTKSMFVCEKSPDAVRYEVVPEGIEVSVSQE